jgi:hypothetical protein
MWTERIQQAISNCRQLADDGERFPSVIAAGLIGISGSPEKASFSIDIYRMFRWIDDNVDESQLPFEHKRRLLTTIERVIKQHPIEADEIEFMTEYGFPDHYYSLVNSPFITDSFRAYMQWSVHGIQRELAYSENNIQPSKRSLESIRMRAILPYVMMMTSLLDGKNIAIDTQEFRQFIHLCQLIKKAGDLRDIDEDMTHGNIRFSDDEIRLASIKNQPQPNDRIKEIKQQTRTDMQQAFRQRPNLLPPLNRLETGVFWYAALAKVMWDCR